MGKKQNMNRDPAKRAAKRKARREAVARGSVINPRTPAGLTGGQADHASNGKARKKRREGEAWLEGERK